MSKQANNRNQLKRQLFLHSKIWLAVAICSMVILSVYNLVVSWLLQKIIDIAAGNDQTSLIFIALIAIATFVVFMIAYVIYRTARPKFIQTAMAQYKASVFEKILGKKIGALSGENTGKLISALTNDMRSVEDYYLDSILTVVDISVSFIGALILMLWYSPVLTLAAVLLSVLPIIVSLPPAKKLAEAEKKVSEGNANYVEIIKDILNNIALYKDFPDSDVQSAFIKAGLSQLIASHGKDYICGENGSALSGGEKQRISIARALLRNTSVLLMDEATAALDEITANGIMNSVLAMEDITRIIVTHRLDESVLREYDEIIVLHRGEVVERGTFDSLIDEHGLFYSLFTVSQ